MVLKLDSINYKLRFINFKFFFIFFVWTCKKINWHISLVFGVYLCWSTTKSFYSFERFLKYALQCVILNVIKSFGFFHLILINFQIKWSRVRYNKWYQSGSWVWIVREIVDDYTYTLRFTILNVIKSFSLSHSTPINFHMKLSNARSNILNYQNYLSIKIKKKKEVEG